MSSRSPLHQRDYVNIIFSFNLEHTPGGPMKRIAQTSFILVGLLAVTPAMAGPQQERMKQCNADAKTQNLSGQSRAAFMKSCLSGKHKGEATAATPATPATPAAPATQQDKMKACNKNAGDKGLKGDARKTFMAECLRG